ncbi:class I SAM-dependent methyltransferase [Saccharopolyspora taberi]|uniref:Class I SAM-dependent methyltransferase n=1 Tax=Saccharopolyspora taberi TaxID=60895 RepID=A0ABN3VIS1_9PSEU
MTERIDLTGAPETMLATLYLRALDSRSPDSILGDRQAAEAVDRIDYDFAKFRVRQKDAPSVAIRAKVLDQWVSRCLDARPEVTVMHLGCGLDSRVDRVDPPASVRWYDVDYPEVIELRRRLYPARPHYETIGSSVTAPGLLDRIPGDLPVLVVAEGLTMYLPPHGGIRLLHRITKHFPSGDMLFDAFSTLGVKLSNRANPVVVSSRSRLSWGIDDPRALEASVPGLELVTEWAFTDAPEMDRYSWLLRQVLRGAARITAFRRMGRLLHYRF